VIGDDAVADLGVSGPGEKFNKWPPPLGRGEGRGLRVRCIFLRVQLQNYILPLISILLPIHNSAFSVGTTVYNKL
jgi:hypothetical protein